jgi:hypothetical protein
MSKTSPQKKSHLHLLKATSKLLEAKSGKMKKKKQSNILTKLFKNFSEKTIKRI